MPKSCRGLLPFALILTAWCGPSLSAQSVTAEPPQVDFQSHDIGTETPTVVTLRNSSAGAVSPSLTLRGDNAGDFKNSQCPNLVPNATCNVTVSFYPLAISSKTDRKAELWISAGSAPAAKAVDLSGSAYENLGVSSNSLTFDDRPVNTASEPLSLIVTNYSEATIPSLTITVAGEFEENHAKCEKILSGSSCAVSVVFSPKHAGLTRGSLTVTADSGNTPRNSRIVVLQGNALVRCAVAFTFWSWHVFLALSVGVLYFAALVMVRWHMIAKPARAQLVAAVNALRARVVAETAGSMRDPEVAIRVERIHYLLDWALYSFKNKSFPASQNPLDNGRTFTPNWPPPYTRLFNALLWPRGQEIAGWSCVHEAEYEMAAVLPLEQVRTGIEMSSPQLRVINTPASLALAAQIDDTLKSPITPQNLDRARSLFAESLGIIYEKGDTDYFQLASWHAKMMWLVGCALLFIFALAATLQNAILLLLGAVGGLLSRLARTVQAADVANDYGASWGALFLSPLCGALSAWGGILLIVLGLKFNIFGSALNVEWCNPYDPATLGIALLLGFSERLFDGIASQLENKFLKSPPDSKPTPPATAPAPSITGFDPPGAATRNEPANFTVKGANFMSNATATVTDEHGTLIPATVQFVDSSTVKVKFTLTGIGPYTSTLTITNPDKTAASTKFQVS